jgi:hypothetical protein
VAAPLSAEQEETMSGHRREDARAEREASGFAERAKYEELGWVVVAELPAPPSAGGATYIMGWTSDDPPRLPKIEFGDAPAGGVL